MSEQQNKLELIVEKSGLDKQKQDYILERFQDFFKIASEWETTAKSIVVTRPDQVAEMKMAREGRLFLKGKRVEIEKGRKELKEQSLREGKTIDGIASTLKDLIEPIEDYLSEQERFVEIEEEKRKEALRIERTALLTPFNIDLTVYNLGEMKQEQFDGLLKAQTEIVENQKKLEFERIAKEKSEAEERERIRIENEKLRKEAERREKEIAEERAKAEAERRAIEEKNRKDREQAEAKAKKEREEAQKSLDEVHKAKEKLEAELKAKAKKEEEERKEKIELEKRAKRAPEKVKLFALAVEIENIKLPDVSSDEAKKIIEDTKSLIIKLTTFIKQKAGTL